METNNKISTRKITAIIAYIICFIFIVAFAVSKLSIGENTEDNTKPYKVSVGGYYPIIVVTGSMEPAIMVNSISIVQDTGIESLEVGDIVAFSFDNELITHRVIEKVTNDNGDIVLHTKGDANQYKDILDITSDMVKGKVIYTNNKVAPILSKYLIGPGELDSIALAQTMIWIFVSVGLLAILIYYLWGFIGMILKVSIKDEAYEKELEKLNNDIESMLKNKEYLDKLINTDNEKGKQRVFNKLARARIMREIRANNESVKDFDKAMKTVRFLSKIDKKD